MKTRWVLFVSILAFSFASFVIISNVSQSRPPSGGTRSPQQTKISKGPPPPPDRPRTVVPIDDTSSAPAESQGKQPDDGTSAPPAEWTSGYNISTSCKIRPNRTNPRQHPELFPCPIPVTWGTDLKAELGPAQYSSRDCVNLTNGAKGHCSYRNVCFNGNRTIHYYQPPGGPLADPDFGWHAYRDHSPHRSFSFHFRTRLHTTAELPKEVKWLKGTSIWFDQSFGNICHTGHSSEFYTKLVELRDRWPGKVERIIYAVDQEFKNRADAYKYCHQTCNLMRIGFPDENFVFPTVFWLEQLQETHKAEMVCYEQLLVPEDSHQHFTSRHRAERNRNQALDMCKIPRRPDAAVGTSIAPRKVFFFERGFDRQFNSEQLCEQTRELGYEAYVETLEDVPDFCQHIATIYSADIIVTAHGSHNYLLAYARPGSVVLFIQPLNLAVPDWKLLAYYAGLRSVELSTFNMSYCLENPNIKQPDNMTIYMSQTWYKCVNTYPCRIVLRHRNTFVPPGTYRDFLDYSISLFNSNTFDDCEVPIPWPMPIPSNRDPAWQLRERGYENNWLVCEPPATSGKCLCCSEPSCVDFMAMAQNIVDASKRFLAEQLPDSGFSGRESLFTLMSPFS
eukprot:TRINITY_DN3776_c0_g1_i1.p1 TRINITY_DN3776_c0_g1~~TRINITY_DN3776_c0_g1_i1.p1  ORF type:complete len:619 (-),score=133.87 TRINITY_DN3776_c0_g1_i1:125-1981(-)